MCVLLCCRAVHRVYVEPLRERCLTGRPIVTTRVLDEIFFNIDTLLGLNVRLLQDLEAAVAGYREKPSHTTSVARVFQDFAALRS